jgi:lauroyl/myristoyl acyltransferase
MIDPDAAEQVSNELLKNRPPSEGILLLTFHGSFFPAAVEAFLRRFKGTAFIGVGQARRNARDATFSALNALRSGGRVLMSPDGFQGRQSAQFEVLGVTMPGGGGAAFLAYTCRCSTVWYTAVKRGDRFAPVIELGPTAREDEDPAEFSNRLHRFYAKKIEENFTGDPNNIVLLDRWAKRFAAAAERASQTSIREEGGNAVNQRVSKQVNRARAFFSGLK